ncbi:hypothetical protein BLNAU_20649 [Blattamonas nauphoetae]|uniref:C2 domain-containing protein n=1 Tax=Blattamonas nauphoetae TaxID=2049346 RepID=A0ABQ9WYA2_9EUKA|nr:hypothetical protein BLNAU_20649 [Blattamonas nauphoetae]
MSWPGRITVSEVTVSNVPAVDFNGLADPFLKMIVGGKTQRTKTIKNCLQPHWKETFSTAIDGSKNTRVLVVELWDWNLVMNDRYLGQTHLQLDEVVNQKVTKKVTIAQKNGKYAGDMNITIQYDAPTGPKSSALPTANRAQPVPPQSHSAVSSAVPVYAKTSSHTAAQPTSSFNDYPSLDFPTLPQAQPQAQPAYQTLPVKTGYTQAPPQAYPYNAAPSYNPAPQAYSAPPQHYSAPPSQPSYVSGTPAYSAPQQPYGQAYQAAPAVSYQAAPGAYYGQQQPPQQGGYPPYRPY